MLHTCTGAFTLKLPCITMYSHIQDFPKFFTITLVVFAMCRAAFATVSLIYSKRDLFKTKVESGNREYKLSSMLLGSWNFETACSLESHNLRTSIYQTIFQDIREDSLRI